APRKINLAPRCPQANRKPRKFPESHIFFKLGQARCLRRMGRRTEGFYTVYRLAGATNPQNVPTAYARLIESALLQTDPLQPPSRHDWQEIRLEARRSANSNLPYFELFNDVLEQDL
ncbi:MAG: hypothetical protein N2556_08785, partial [Anaerolineae bacterium]|nr:hypothetical protein [Anaerolineae bacterium]